MTRAQRAALKAYPIPDMCGAHNMEVYNLLRVHKYYKEGYEQAEKDLGWHSVEEFLPEEKGWYFTCIDDNGTPQALGVTYFDGTEWTDDDDSTENVDYWMSCPKIPNSEEL